MTKAAQLVLADGTSFTGKTLGADGSTVGEVVFTTGMTGYQEVLTDPSYCGQIVVMTAPEMGNTGTTPEDGEAERPYLSGFVVHHASPLSSNWRSQEDLDTYLKRHHIVSISDVDTRALTRHIRDHGAQMAAIGTESVSVLQEKAKAAGSMEGRNLVREVTTSKPYAWTQGSHHEWLTDSPIPGGQLPHLVAMDFGIKHNILRCMVDAGFRVTVVPAHTSAEAILELNPDGIFLSNGPGDPAAVDNGISTTKALLGKKPMFGICLGHQILALALGAKTYKLKFGHHGLNQPVLDLTTRRVEITSQNHGFCVDEKTLPKDATMTHVHLNDNTCEGFMHAGLKVMAVQYHPEAGAGPHDARYLFERFRHQVQAES